MKNFKKSIFFLFLFSFNLTNIFTMEDQDAPMDQVENEREIGVKRDRDVDDGENEVRLVRRRRGTVSAPSAITAALLPTISSVAPTPTVTTTTTAGGIPVDLSAIIRRFPGGGISTFVQPQEHDQIQDDGSGLGFFDEGGTDQNSSLLSQASIDLLQTPVRPDITIVPATITATTTVATPSIPVASILPAITTTSATTVTTTTTTSTATTAPTSVIESHVNCELGYSDQLKIKKIAIAFAKQILRLTSRIHFIDNNLDVDLDKKNKFLQNIFIKKFYRLNTFRLCFLNSKNGEKIRLNVSEILFNQLIALFNFGDLPEDQINNLKNQIDNCVKFHVFLLKPGKLGRFFCGAKKYLSYPFKFAYNTIKKIKNVSKINFHKKSKNLTKVFHKEFIEKVAYEIINYLKNSVKYSRLNGELYLDDLAENKQSLLRYFEDEITGREFKEKLIKHIKDSLVGIFCIPLNDTSERIDKFVDKLFTSAKEGENLPTMFVKKLKDDNSLHEDLKLFLNENPETIANISTVLFDRFNEYKALVGKIASSKRVGCDYVLLSVLKYVAIYAPAVFLNGVAGYTIYDLYKNYYDYRRLGMLGFACTGTSGLLFVDYLYEFLVLNKLCGIQVATPPAKVIHWGISKLFFWKK